MASAAVSLNDDVDTDKELMAHGYSNLLSGLVGSVYVFKPGPCFNTHEHIARITSSM